MRFCIHCGAQLPDNQRFCTECGGAQPVAPQNPGRPAAPQNPGRPAAPQRPVNPPVRQAPMQPSAPGSYPSEPTSYVPKPDAQSYTTYIPKRQESAAPQQSYTPPQQGYTPPQQSYTPPQQSYTPPQQSYTPPQQDYTIPQSAPSGQPQPGFTMGAGKEKKPGKKKGGLIVLILLLLALIGGCVFFFLKGGMDLFSGNEEKEEDPALGVYNAVSCVYDDEEQDVDGEWLELKKNGKGKLFLGGDNFTFKWELDGEDLTILQAGDTYIGTLEDGVISIDINGREYIYEKEGYEPDETEGEKETEGQEETTPTEAPVETIPETTAPVVLYPSDLEYWEGDWYGWWIINTVYEGDPEQEGAWWDCCAHLEIDPYGNATLSLWDEDGSRTELLGEAELKVTIVDGDVAKFSSVSGEFGGMPVGYNDWSCRSDDEDDYDEMLWFTAEYDDGDGLSFEYTFFMRKWGVRWDDIAENDPGLMPYYYEDWYLPLIEAGATEAPNTIG